MDTGKARTLPLEDLHRAAGAKLGDFAGWSMPLTYPLGVMKEHLHAREKAGLFDISHMQLFALEGPEAAPFLAQACPLEPDRLGIGRSKYTLLLDEGAGILDDLIVTRLGDARFIIVANAGNAEADETHLRRLMGNLDCRLIALDRIFLALQGPQAEAVLEEAGIIPLPQAFMQASEPREGWFLSRSGYTGEDGFEIALGEADARHLADKLLADERVAWIGLAARDSLRLEAGLCLHGQDITPSRDPVEAGLMWAISRQVREAGRFNGAAALRAKLAGGAQHMRVGLKPEGRQPVRAGAKLTNEAGVEVGIVTSGGFGPTVGHPVAMGYVAASQAVSPSRLFADVRGTRIPVDIHPLPFTPHRYRRG